MSLFRKRMDDKPALYHSYVIIISSFLSLTIIFAM